MNKIDLQQTVDRRLSALRWTQDDSRTVFEQLKGEKKVKKKLSLGLVLALILILAATAALAAFALNRAPQADIVNRARQALYGKYGLNAQTVGLFTWSVEKQGDTEAVTFTGDGYHVSLLGVYTVVFDKDGKASASWSYDDADKALYESGDMSCPIWAQKQMAAALSNPEKASEISVALYKAYQSEHKERPAVTPQPIPDLKEGETWWQGEILRAGTPGENDMSKEEAIKIAQAVILRIMVSPKRTARFGKSLTKTLSSIRAKISIPSGASVSMRSRTAWKWASAWCWTRRQAKCFCPTSSPAATAEDG